MDNVKKKILILTGPTATGKTDLALFLAKKFDGELISADSRQVYKGLDLGTGKLPSSFETLQKKDGCWLIDGIPIYLYDVRPITEQYTAYDFIQDATAYIKTIHQQDKLPILVGGTPFYISALLHGLSSTSTASPERREFLESQTLDQLQAKARETPYWQKMNESDQKNKRRLIRVLERGVKTSQKQIRGIKEDYDLLTVGLIAEREVLNNRVDKRVVSRIEEGMIEEARNLRFRGISITRMRQLGLEYGVMADLLEGVIEKDRVISILQTKIHQFVKRQLTWFKKDQNIRWFNITDVDLYEKVANALAVWYYSPNG
jgi:tRNA dimethylallyltransferase